MHPWGSSEGYSSDGEDGAGSGRRRGAGEGGSGPMESKKPENIQNTRESIFSLVKVARITSYYKIGARIGNRGAYGEVRKAVSLRDNYLSSNNAGKDAGDAGYASISTADSHVAVKILKKQVVSAPLSLATDLKGHQFYKEIRTLHSLTHPKIVRFVDAFEDEQRLYLVMELCQGGDLFEFIESHGGKLTEQEAKLIMRQLISAVEYLHERGVVHCDIKPNNIMFASSGNSNSVRLIDFGQSQILETPTQSLSEHIGTSGYMAPEVLYESYNSKCDVWSLGVVMFVMLMGFNPFDPYGKLSVESIERRVLKGFVNRTEPGYGAWFPENGASLSEEARDLISLMLLRDASERPNISELLEHTFFESI